MAATKRGKASSRSSGSKSASTRRGGGGGATRKGSGASSSRGSARGSSRRSRSSSQTTTDHEQIRAWAEERGGKPSCVLGTGGGGDTGLLRIDFPGFSGEGKLQEISWDEFFEKFDEQGLALVFQETTSAGEKSNFNKLVSRESAEQKQSGSRGGRSGGGRSGGGRGSSGGRNRGG
jgi:hypothetical protein